MRLARPMTPPPVFKPGAGVQVFEIAAIVLALALSSAAGAINSGAAAVIATLAFLVGGLPHGAFDIHLAARQAGVSRGRLIGFAAIYVALFAIMLAGWRYAPTITLPIFLITAIVHFSADWPETDEPIFRAALGFAPLCAIGIGHLDQVEAIFAAMSTPALALWATRTFILVAPVTLLIAGVALAVIAQRGAWQRPAVFAALLASLVVLPALIGFALFFCVFHTPRHLTEICCQLAHWPTARLIVVGAGMTGLALLLGGLALPPILAGGLMTAATGFQVLAALAMPHQCMEWILRSLGRSA
jgi:Brp/Blh family beta-carotene 15,15'-monooxygenase